MARWDRAIDSGGIVVLNDIEEISSDGQWDTPERETAVRAGRIEVARQLPASHDKPFLVANGQASPIRPLSAEETPRRAIQAASPERVAACGGCAPLRVVGARPVTLPLTVVGGGGVTVPGWEYRVEGTGAQLTANAVPAGTVTEFDGGAEPPDEYWYVGVVRIRAVAGPALAVTVSVAIADPPCAAPAGEAAESARAVVLLFPTSPSASAGPCPPGSSYDVTVPLRQPLGDRPVLSLAGGTPYPISP